MAGVRKAEYEDLDGVARLYNSVGWRPPTEHDWQHLWNGNPALGGTATPARGWVLVEEGAVVGFLGNIAQSYQLGQRRLLAGVAAGLVVAPPFRGSSLQLLVTHAKQPEVDLLLNATAAPHVSKIAEFLKFMRVPQPDYDRSFYWVLRPAAFARAALRKKGCSALVSRVGGPVLAPLLALEGRLRGRRPGASVTGVHLRTIDSTAIGPQFDDLWQSKLAEGLKLLAVRDARTLRWHFASRGRPNAPALVCAYRQSQLVGYAAIVRQDAPHLGLARARLADLFVERDDPELIQQLLGGAAAEARRGGAAMLEVVGFPAHVRRILRTFRPFELVNESWPFLFKAADPALQSELAVESRWHACLFDGDGSL